ncbi:MAG: hypothetical protein J5604_04555 [Bacteroidales bacterium]|nr:hypothetical protein [Bacteroidales bacterium]
MKEKLKYDAPLCDEYAVTLEGVIAESPISNVDPGDPWDGTPSEEDWTS